MTAPVRVSPAWLELRDPPDAAARATDLVDELRRELPRRIVVHDLGCGTGSMARWLVPRLAGSQHWIMYDRDADLLAHVPARMPAAAADGSPITAETRRRDITRLDHRELAGASLITASALLDMLSADEIDRIVTTCVGVGCLALLTISVTGRVELTPPDPLDETISAAFNAHQRRSVDGRRLLGPDAADAAADMFARRGADVLVRPSAWRLDEAHAALTTAWFTGWVGAACEQQPELSGAVRAYVRRRRADAADGHLRVIVHHDDLLVLPR